jgi:hypothetical protein
MDLSDVFQGKAAEVYYRILPLLGLVQSEKRARNLWCEYQRALATGKKVEQPWWPDVVVRPFGGKLVVFRGELEAAANDAAGILAPVEIKKTVKNEGKRGPGRPRKTAVEG